MAANMDTVGLFSVAKEMSKNLLFTAIDKHVSVDEWIQFINKNPECAQYLAVSSGITEQDSINLNNVLQAVPQISYICLDVANGYTEHFVQYVKNTRSKYPNKTIIVIS
jgi:GMP reductase